MSVSIAIVGMACHYPDARSPEELWENVLAQRRAFRRMPDERVLLEDYHSPDREAQDRFYATNAALIEGYEFDRIRFRVPQTTFRSTDMAHWLALDIASQALNDAGFVNAEGLDRETTGVFLGNTLTGEFSRAAGLRLRWPYVRRVVEACLAEEEWSPERCDRLLRKVERVYKEPFPPITEDSLAGSLSNTIAGRICNHFGLKGGGYAVDGACASSLLAVANACSTLAAGDLDVALAGGVDLSLDPFELVGFAKAGALATDVMRVYDVKSNGFWPGEGCGFVVLMRQGDALAHGCRIYASVKGWGISSDGGGAITRPEIEGQLLSLRRAYRRACFGIETVAYFEGHGTGTSIGDFVELQALSRLRREATRRTPPAAIGSIKANIGHTKAAAGVAGLIKTTMALHSRILPPTTGCDQPRDELNEEQRVLRVLGTGEPWPADQYLRAGVSSMGFGGINTHVVLEVDSPKSNRAPISSERALVSSAQDGELFMLGAQSAGELGNQVEHLLNFAAKLSFAELSDLAAELAGKPNYCQVRAAIVAADPTELAQRLETLRAGLKDRITRQIEVHAGVFLSSCTEKPRLGFLFPGQGSPANIDGGIWRRRFELVQRLYHQAQLVSSENSIATSVAQPAIVTASLAALGVLSSLNVSAEIAVGHSLGELTALRWAGVFDDETLLGITKVRGKAMMAIEGPVGAMASIAADVHDVEALLNGEPVKIAALNSPRQTVISGEATAVASVAARARAKDLVAIELQVSHAFHSPLIAPAAPILAAHLAHETFNPLHSTVVSTITGEILTTETNLRELLYKQIISPVLFMQAANKADSGGVDLWIEVGPGRTLQGLMAQITGTPVVSLDAGGSSLKGLLHAVGACYVLGQQVSCKALFAGRLTRPFTKEWQKKFFVNPCELAPASRRALQANIQTKQPRSERVPITTAGPLSTSALDVITQLVVKRAEYPPSSVKSESRLLSDLHLNSITVSQLVIDAAERLGLPRPVSATDYADATIAEVAQALDDQILVGHGEQTTEVEMLPDGIDSWVKPFSIELVEQTLRRRQPSGAAGTWRVVAPVDYEFADLLRQAFNRCSAGHGVVVCLPHEPDEQRIRLLLEGARAVLKGEQNARFVVVQHGAGCAAFARTLHLEAPQIVTCVVNVPPSHPRAVDWVIAEALSAEQFVEVHYDTEGKRSEPVMRALPLADNSADPLLNPADVLVVTGGGKGITAECALTLAKESGASLALLGTAQPETDTELADNLKRMTALGINLRYISVDVTDPQAVRAASRKIEAELGPITGIIHGAGRNVPHMLHSLTEEVFRQTVAVKVQGARNLLAAIDPDKLRLFVSFGSIIARTGLPGEAHYAAANEWLTDLTEQWQSAHPGCRCIAVEWSIWSGVGMGVRLGRIDVLAKQGITPIPPEDGTTILRRLLSQGSSVCPVVVMGRFREMPTFRIEKPALPLLRFLEQPSVYYPDVELITETDLSTGTDQYLNDHQVQGESLLPAVIGLEAMAQVATALVNSTKLPSFEDVTFNRPVVVPKIGFLKIRIAALARTSKLVEVAVRSEETAFQIDHFRATCRFESHTVEGEEPIKFLFENGDEVPLPINPEQDLYGRILFHRGRFRRLKNYRLLKAKQCFAEIKPDGTSPWFSQYLPAKLLLGDPGARDAAIHSVQACVPYETLLPVRVDRVSPGVTQGSAPLFVHAQERSHSDNTFIYDLHMINAKGHVCERWEGVSFRAVSSSPPQGSWPVPLLSCYVERRINKLIPDSQVTVAVEVCEGTERRAETAGIVRRSLGEDVAVLRRPDGKPEINGDGAVSVAHTSNLTLVIAGPGPIGCDFEQVVERPNAAWRVLLGAPRAALAEVISRNVVEGESTSATRVWTAIECLRKAGAGLEAPLLFVSSEPDGWVLLASGRLKVASYVGRIRDHRDKLAIAVLVKSDDARL